jgi:GNAT superfamily N-acetyltransferase
MTNYTDYTFEIIWITRPQDLIDHPQLIDAFFELYEDPSNFPDPDEREDPAFIKERIADGTDNPHTHLLAYQLISPSGEKQFAAGCIVEFYPDSSCGLVTYLFVDQRFRGIKIGISQQKVAESLIQNDRGLTGLVKYFAQQYGKKVNAVLFESNNPFDTLPENDSMPPAKRLKFFSRMGARRIDFNYIQPPLGDGKGIVTNLYLLSFPFLTGLTDLIPVETVIRFVMELAKSLDANKEPDSTSSYGIENYLQDIHTIDLASGSPELAGISAKLIGLSAEGRNVIREMFQNLMDQRADDTSVRLTPIPGVDI